AFGRCSADCSTATCPSGTECAHLGDGRALCMAACGVTVPCNDDPLMACEAPGASGALGFTLPGTTASATYCAPRRCNSATECAPSGTCVAGHCVRAAAP
ncbi:MAG: hypothetical protein ABUS79_23445, partial [Pseudomonadota bacterium]